MRSFALGPLFLSLALVFGAPAAAVAQDGEGGASAIFAGGCFWCMEPPFDAVPGVTATISGYIGGRTPNPTYNEVSSGRTGHKEAVRVVYDPSRVTYEQLLAIFWRNIDPHDARGQFCDRGDQYTSAIFVASPEQRQAAEASLRAVSARLNGRVVTEILPAATFHPAEDYHQNYYRKNAAKYKYYRFACGRDRRLEEVWGPAS
ncbi:peptide-methionine (S)-S-oxide reductase MsrA [Chelatococcus daeguensis]|uniref:Peptide methionine sulfoxide reductase MsrA n=2 Tax=Chelatococcus TaxID=28209 RepID=A0AAC9JPR4_9HYPH|nr:MULTISPECIES: peptide-methionine (S)-S-oxide reductase MsrA [Chelatococcus]APF37917.1 peptide-methionine (S)-S-oxide reductase [Chelatococcus daeguensis]KZE28415.1 peptide methionine sulfoxide reductase [Chelatococcus daeguensis]MBM3083366.1 peptide-methionine (S)-S-oxide reductase MsrA [Chelatococcus daeguensis]CUA83802.1 methionine-S-sulfoxide reductase [Chelatococcus sambhunathii]